MTDLVISHKEGVYADSRIVAEKFNKRHTDVITTIVKLIEDFNTIRPITNLSHSIKREGISRGKRYVYYEMDRKFFSQLVMRFKGREAFEWQQRFIDAFFDMEHKLAIATHNKNNEEWKLAREQVALARKEETDVIKQFVEYATKQGSTHAKFYYKHITNTTYKCLGLIQYKHPKLRDTLDTRQISQLIVAEMVAKKSLIAYMKAGENYKVIFTLVKQDIENFANSFILPMPEKI